MDIKAKREFIRKTIAEMFYDIWLEGKDTDEGWTQFEDLPDKHRHEYYLTVGRLLQVLHEAGVEIVDRESGRNIETVYWEELYYKETFPLIETGGVQ